MPDVHDALPADLSGWTVVDLGGFNHGVGQECLNRGAVRAVMVDNAESLQYGWGEPGVPENSPVQFVRADLHDWREPADVVVCSNVIYHVKDPLATLKHIRGLTRRVLVLRTSFAEPNHPDVRDGWHWYANGDGHPNGTVWCRPTLAGLEDYLHRADFPEVETVGVEGDHVLVRCPVPKEQEAYAKTTVD